MRGLKLLLLVVAISSTMCEEFELKDYMFEGHEMMTLKDMSKPIESEEYQMIERLFLAAAGESDAEPSTPSPSPSDPAPKPSTMDNIIGAFGKLTNKWGQIVEAFKTTRKTEIKERLTGKGMDFFAQSAQVQITKGLKAQYLDQFLTSLGKRLKVPEERQEDVNSVLEQCKWADSNVWSAYDTLFSIDKGGNTKFASIIVAHNDQNDTYDFVFSDIKSEFKLAPDVLVISKSLSVLGGIWQDSKDEFVKVPRAVTPEDYEMVMKFFQIIAFKSFADQFGIKLELPKF